MSQENAAVAPGASSSLVGGSQKGSSPLDQQKGGLFKRKDFLEIEPDANLQPHRTYYYRKHADLDGLIEQCNKRLVDSPHNIKALATRATCFMKKKMFGRAVEDFSAVIAALDDNSSGSLGPGSPSSFNARATAALASAGTDAASIFYSRGTAYDKLGHTNEAIVSRQQPAAALSVWLFSLPLFIFFSPRCLPRFFSFLPFPVRRPTFPVCWNSTRLM